MWTSREVKIGLRGDLGTMTNDGGSRGNGVAFGTQGTFSKEPRTSTEGTQWWGRRSKENAVLPCHWWMVHASLKNLPSLGNVDAPRVEVTTTIFSGYENCRKCRVESHSISIYHNGWWVACLGRYLSNCGALVMCHKANPTLTWTGAACAKLALALAYALWTDSARSRPPTSDPMHVGRTICSAQEQVEKVAIWADMFRARGEARWEP